MRSTPHRAELRTTLGRACRAAGGMAAALVLMLAGTGCTRTQYREQADRDVYGLIAMQPKPVVSPTADYSIIPSPASRMYDPTSPDHPAMPPDDPQAHRLMHCIDGKKGWKHWHDNGDLSQVEDMTWTAYLPYNDQGDVVLDLTAATEVAYQHSREYQTELEDLYLSALDVSFERFLFDTQFFATHDLDSVFQGRDLAGGQTSSRLFQDVNVEARRLNAWGGEWVVGLANSLVWEFSGPNTQSAASILDVSLIQPLLRGASKARVLERLTVAERTLLYNVRQMQRYRQGFVTEVATGVDAGAGPTRRGGLFGGAGLSGFTGVGAGGFGQVGGFGGGGGGTGAGQAGGFWGRLRNLQEIRNQAANVVALRDSLAQLEASYDAGRIDKFQVDQARQALYGAQSVLVTQRVAYQDALDTYKISLGLPPTLPVELDERALKPYELISPRLTAVQAKTTTVLDQLRQLPEAPEPAAVEAVTAELDALRAQVDSLRPMLDEDFADLEAKKQQRKDGLAKILGGSDLQIEGLDVREFRPESLDLLIENMQRSRVEMNERLRKVMAEIEAHRKLGPAADAEAAGERRLTTLELGTTLSGVLLELSLLQAAARLETIHLPNIELTEEQAWIVASQNRLDWMNARASVVDTWRLIEFNANALKADLDVVVDGQLNTTGDQLLRFDGHNSQLRLGLRFDAPTTRLAERNTYRQSLIDYQRSRRSYMQYEDQVSRGLRTTLRSLDRNRINFELRRAAVRVAIQQVELTQLRLNQPQGGVQFGATTARDLLSALTDLLSVQNQLLSVGVNDEVLRMVLDRDLGTMRLDERGLWIDPGRFDHYAALAEMGGCLPDMPPGMLPWGMDAAPLDGLPEDDLPPDLNLPDPDGPPLLLPDAPNDGKGPAPVGPPRAAKPKSLSPGPPKLQAPKNEILQIKYLQPAVVPAPIPQRAAGDSTPEPQLRMILQP